VSISHEIVDRICNRLRLHWAAAECSGDVDAAGTLIVRVRVVDSLWLELRSPNPPTPDGIVPPWSARPIEVNTHGAERVVSHTYAVGLRSPATAEDVGDRFYEEIRFWWAEYARIATSTR